MMTGDGVRRFEEEIPRGKRWTLKKLLDAEPNSKTLGVVEEKLPKRKNGAQTA